jgi:outer membrane protein OmpA-like peptidoglycan-associated protein
MRLTQRAIAERPNNRGAIISRLLAAAAAVTLAMPAQAQDQPQQPQQPQQPEPTLSHPQGEKAKVSGWIISRRGNDLLVRDETTRQLSIVSLTQDTKVTEKAGVLDLDRKARDATELLPGLKVEVKGAGGDNGEIVATKISFHGRSQRIAQGVAAGEVDLKAMQKRTADSLAAVTARAKDTLEAMTARARDSISALNKSFNERISNLDNYDTRFASSVNFATGSAMLSDEAKKAIDDVVARTSGDMNGYMFEVLGYTDNTGSVKFNQALSRRRAQAVATYLAEQHHIQPRFIATPTGLGEERPVGDNSSAEGRAMNRRVEIKLLVNKGIKPNGQ